MFDIALLGLNHKTAPVELREKLVFSEHETANSLKEILKIPCVDEAFILSTCNRVEVVFATDQIKNALKSIEICLAEIKNVTAEMFKESVYIYNGDDAVRHVFMVASSLDSMVVGEPQILGQLKEAYSTASKNKTTGVILNRLFHKSFFVAKRVRTETAIGENAVSISYAAVELGRKIFGTFKGKKVLLIGAGEMAELAVEHLIRNRVENIFVANRTFERGLKLSKRFNGKAIKFEEIPETLNLVDIIISSTGSHDFIVTSDHVKRAMRNRKNRPVFFVDIAVPRDIDPKINRLNNTYVYDIDDLKGVIDENIEDRKKESIKGERIIEEAVVNFRHWHESLEAVPTIIALRNKMDAIAKEEIKKTMHSLTCLSDNDGIALEKMTNAIIKKILHDPTLFLKKNGKKGKHRYSIDYARKLFNLD